MNEEPNVNAEETEAIPEPAQETDLPEEEAETEAEMSGNETDYAALAAEDLAFLRKEFPELADLGDLGDLPDPRRFGELRELGLSPREAYLATGKIRREPTDNRAHLHSSVPRFAAGQTGGMTGGELAAARELFGGMTDSEIRKLYKRVTD